MLKTNIDEIDAFIKAEIELIGGEENAQEQAALWKVFHNGVRAILMAQLRIPPADDETYDKRARRRIEIVKSYLKESGHGKSVK